jgi:hypothetical protein
MKPSEGNDLERWAGRKKRFFADVFGVTVMIH